jgi:hypothetical protein
MGALSSAVIYGWEGMPRKSSPENKPANPSPEFEKLVEKLEGIYAPKFAEMGINAGRLSIGDDGRTLFLPLAMSPDRIEDFLNLLFDKDITFSNRISKAGESADMGEATRQHWTADERKRRSKPKTDTPEFP